MAVPQILAGPPGSTWSNAIRLGDEVAMSGLVARAPNGTALHPGDVEGQTLAIFAQVKSRLESLGGNLSNVYKLVVYLIDMAGREGVNRARAATFGPVFPCSTLVGVNALTGPDFLIEIDVFANLGYALNG